MNNFVLGQYVPGKSYIYKLDPRVKIISTILLMVAVFFLKNYYEMLGAIGFTLIILLTSRISIFKALKGLRPLLMLSIFVFLFQIFFNKSGYVIHSKEMYLSIDSIVAIVLLTLIYFLTKKYIKLNFLYFLLFLTLIYFSLAYLNNFYTFLTFNLEIYKNGLDMSLFIFFRLIAIVFIATLLTLSTKPTDLTLGIEFLLKPLKVIKINPEEIALIITIALRYIPTIMDEAYKIMDAQASRGADFKSGSIVKKVKIIVSLLVPMFVMSFERSDELADAMLSRNFVPGKKKTRYHVLKWKTIDTFVLIFSILVLGGAICLSILL